MLSPYPGQSVSKSGQILVLWPISIAPAVCESSKGVAETDGGMPERTERELTHHRTISGDISRIKTNAGKETFQSGVAVFQQILLVEPATRLVDERGLKDTRVRHLHSLVLTIVLRQTKSHIRGHNRTGRA